MLLFRILSCLINPCWQCIFLWLYKYLLAKVIQQQWVTGAQIKENQKTKSPVAAAFRANLAGMKGKSGKYNCIDMWTLSRYLYLCICVIHSPAATYHSVGYRLVHFPNPWCTLTFALYRHRSLMGVTARQKGCGVSVDLDPLSKRVIKFGVPV